MTEAGAELLKRLRVEHLESRAERGSGETGVLSQFKAVNSVDSTQISLAPTCQELFAGSGGSASTASAKLPVSYEYLSGTFNALDVGSGRVSEQSRAVPQTFACAGSLTLLDLGYFKQARRVAIDRADAYFVTRLHRQVNLYWNATDTVTAEVVGFLKRQPQSSGQLTVYLGAEARLPVTLVCRKRPPELVAQQRRRALRNAQKKHRTCSGNLMPTLPQSVLNVQSVVCCTLIYWACCFFTPSSPQSVSCTTPNSVCLMPFAAFSPPALPSSAPLLIVGARFPVPWSLLSRPYFPSPPNPHPLIAPPPAVVYSCLAYISLSFTPMGPKGEVNCV